MRSPDFIRDRAKALRRQMTRPETMLWFLLRRNQAGLHSRRQHPVGPFILDFYCANAKLAVEIDGPVHDQQHDHDMQRTLRLAKEGITVLRFTTADVETWPAAVLQTIVQAAPPSTA